MILAGKAAGDRRDRCRDDAIADRELFSSQRGSCCYGSDANKAPGRRVGRGGDPESVLERSAAMSSDRPAAASPSDAPCRHGFSRGGDYDRGQRYFPVLCGGDGRAPAGASAGHCGRRRRRPGPGSVRRCRADAAGVAPLGRVEPSAAGRACGARATLRRALAGRSTPGLDQPWRPRARPLRRRDPADRWHDPGQLVAARRRRRRPRGADRPGRRQLARGRPTVQEALLGGRPELVQGSDRDRRATGSVGPTPLPRGAPV